MSKVYRFVAIVVSLFITQSALAGETLTLSLKKISAREAATQAAKKVQELWVDTDILLSGEDHRDVLARQLFMVAAINAAKSMKEKKCVFNEWSANYQYVFDALPDLEKAKELYTAEFQLTREKWKKLMGAEPGDNLDLTVFQHYSENKFRIYTSDVAFDDTESAKAKVALESMRAGDQTPFLEYAVWERSQNFVNTIVKNKSDCEKSIGIYGSGHIIPLIPNDDPNKTVTALLKAQGLRVKTVILAECTSETECATPPTTTSDLVIKIVR